MKGTGSRADLQPEASSILSGGGKCFFLGVLQGGDTSQCIFQGHKLTQVYCARIQLKIWFLIKNQSSQVPPHPTWRMDAGTHGSPELLGPGGGGDYG